MISRFLSNYYMAKVKWVKLKRLFDIPRGEKVLDIGGGDGPFPRADVVCEKFLGDNSERTRPFLFDRPLVLGDLEALPFLDQSFDFVYCSHILEHASDPAKAISEITRIGRRGFIEVPSEYLELAATSTPAHLWTIRRDADGTLVFKPKAQASPNPYVDAVFREKLWGRDGLYMAFHWKNYYSLFNIGLYWEGKIPYVILRPPEAVEGSFPDDHSGFQKGTVESLESIKTTLEAAARSAGFSWDPRKWIKNGVRRFFTDPRTPEWLIHHLACPACAGAMSLESETVLACSSCRRTVPRINGVPILLKEHATRDSQTVPV